MKTNNQIRSGRFARHVAVGGFLAALALLPAAAHAQGAIEAWVQRYNGPGNGDDYAWAMAVDTNGNVVVTGYSYGGDPLYGGSNMDYATIKYSNAGVPLWTNRYKGPGNGWDEARAVAVDASGNVFVTGRSEGSGSWGDYATIKYSAAGVPLWTNSYNGPANSQDDAVAIGVDTNGNVFVTGNSYNGVNWDFVTIKYSAAGVPLWTRRYNGPVGYDDEYGVALATDAAGNVVVTGQSRGIAGSYYATLKYSSAGVPLWTNLYGGGNDLVFALALDSSGNAVVTGRSQGTNTWNDFLTIKYSSAGVPLWTNRYDGPDSGNDWPEAVAVDAGGNVVVTGPVDSTGSVWNYGTIKYSSAGVLLWTNFYNGPGNDMDLPHAVAVDASGNVYVTGESRGSGTSSDYATVAYSSAGVPLWTNRYGWPGNNRDGARAVALDASGNVYVSGKSSTSGDDYPHAYDFATVKYVVPPIITVQPLSQTNAIGITASFTVEAAGGVPLSYQWRRQETNLANGVTVSGVTTTNLLIANAQLADVAGYTVVVTNVYGSGTSIVAQLTVTIPPSPGRFTHLSYSPETGLSFIFRDATVGKPYRIQTSPSLAEGSWVDWLNFNYTGPVLLTDLGALDSTNKFYRSISP